MFVIAALYAGVAGFLFAHFQRFISPTPFSLGASIDYLFMVIIGGAGSLWGAPVGAALVVVLRDQFNDWIPRLTGRVGDFELLVFSLVVIVLLQRAPDGLLPLLARLKPGRTQREEAASDDAAEAPRRCRRRGHARHGIAGTGSDLAQFRRAGGEPRRSFAVHASEIVALIGPNGAGKTTLFNVISGVIPPNSGHIRLFGAPAGHLPPRRIAALGLARTFQHVKLLPTRSVLENIALGAHLSGRAGLLRAMLRLDRAEEARLLSEARAQAVRVGLGACAGHAGGRPAAGPAARGGDRPRALPAPAPAVAGRARRRAAAGGKAVSRRAAAPASCRRHGGAAGRARHGLRHAARRSRGGDGFRPEDRRGSARTRPVRSGRDGSLSGRPDMTSPLLQLDGLRAGYGHVEVLHGVSLAVPSGKMVAIVGPNGAGKTTLMGAVMGLLPRRGGAVRYWDAPAGATEAMVASGAVLVPEQRALFADMSVEDNLLLGFYPRRRAGERDAGPSMRDVFAIFPRLEERRRQLAATLSGGERQMLALGRALMGRPRLLLLDEPSLGLAPMLVREIFRVLVDLRSRGLSILLVEQNVRAALQVSDYGYVLEMGEVAAEGHSAELARNPRVLETYLGQRRGHACE